MGNLSKGEIPMATRRRRPLRSTAHSNLPARTGFTTKLARQLAGAATSPAAKAAYVTIGSMGLAALAIAVFGPKRFQREILQPAGRAVSDRADQIWADSRGLREQLGGLIDRAGSEAGRDKLVRSFQSWVGHFKAT
jgi:hypothetical protein